MHLYAHTSSGCSLCCGVIWRCPDGERVVVDPPGMGFLPYLLSNNMPLIFSFHITFGFHLGPPEHKNINWCNVLAKALKHEVACFLRKIYIKLGRVLDCFG